MAKILVNKKGSIVRYTFQESLLPEKAKENTKKYNGIPALREEGFRFYVELEPSERASWFVSYKQRGDLKDFEKLPAAYPFVYRCDICEINVATDTQLEALCPSCSAPLRNHISNLEYHNVPL